MEETPWRRQWQLPPVFLPGEYHGWRIPWTEKPGGLQSIGSQESDTTERLSTGTLTHTHIVSFKQGKGQEIFLLPKTSKRGKMKQNIFWIGGASK